MERSGVRGVIFDVDGTLVDSNDEHARAWVEALAEHGYEVPLSKVRPLIGKGGDKLLPEVSGLSPEHPPGREIDRRRGEIFRERYLPGLRPCPGARELLLEMRRRGLRLVVASSAKKEELLPLLRVAGVEELMEELTSSGDAERSKPDPDIVEVALAGLGLPAQAVLMIGDTPYDVEAAGRTHLRTIALRCGGSSDRDLAGAAAIYDHPQELLARYDSSPLGSS